jgi:hypothetical protein
VKFLRIVLASMLVSLAMSISACAPAEQVKWTQAEAKTVVMDSWQQILDNGGQENFSDGGENYRIMYQPGGEYMAMYINDSTGDASLVFETTTFMLFNAWAMVQASDLTFATTPNGFSLKVPDWAVPMQVTVKEDRVHTVSYDYEGTVQVRDIQYSVDEDLKQRLLELVEIELG